MESDDDRTKRYVAFVLDLRCKIMICKEGETMLYRKPDINCQNNGNFMEECNL